MRRVTESPIGQWFMTHLYVVNLCYDATSYKHNALTGEGEGGSRPLWLIPFGMRGSIIKLSIILYLVRVDI